MPAEITSAGNQSGTAPTQTSSTATSPSGSGGQAPVSTPAPSTPSAPSQQTQVSAPQATPGQQPDASQQQQQQQTQRAAWIESLRQRGVNVPDAEDAAIQQIQTWQQQQAEFQQHVPYYRSYLQNRDQFNQFLRAQAQAASQQQQQQPGQQEPYWSQVWKPPVEFNPMWLSQIQKDPTTGNLVGPPEIVAKYEQYVNYQRERQQEFWQNPVKFLEPAIQHVAAEVAQQMVRQHLGQYTDVQRSMSFVNSPENAWLYERDPSTGAPRVEPQWDPSTGAMENRRVLSPYGRRFSELLNQEHQRQTRRGYYDLNEQKDFAMLRLRAELGQMQQQQQQQPANPAQPAQQQTQLAAANAAFLQQHGGQQPATPATPGNRQTAQQPVTRSNFQQVLADRFAKVGYQG